MCYSKYLLVAICLFLNNYNTLGQDASNYYKALFYFHLDSNSLANSCLKYHIDSGGHFSQSMLHSLLNDNHFTINELLQEKLLQLYSSKSSLNQKFGASKEYCDELADKLIRSHEQDQSVVTNPHDRSNLDRSTRIYPYIDSLTTQWIAFRCPCTNEHEWAFAFLYAHSCREPRKAVQRLDKLYTLVKLGCLSPWLFARIVDDSHLARGKQTVYGTLLPGHLHPGLIQDDTVRINNNRSTLYLPEVRYEHSHVYIYPWYYSN